MGTTVVLLIHVFLAIGIVGLVLIQRGKGADAGAGFGSGASGTVFGARGSATVLSKATAILATLFFVTSLALAYMAGHRTREPSSLLERTTTTAPAPAPKADSPPDLTAPPAPAPASATPPPSNGEPPKPN
jgi:preprotein translocase subunit SecG